MSRLLTIGVIWLGCALAWSILGSSLTVRSHSASDARGEEVHGLWGAPLHQQPPAAHCTVVTTEEETQTVKRAGKAPVTTTTSHRVRRDVAAPLEATDIDAAFALEHRKRGLLWFATYQIDFAGRYLFRNPVGESCKLTMRLPLQTASRTYDGLRIENELGEPLPFEIVEGSARWELPFEGGQERAVALSFGTRGTDSWTYTVSPGGQEARSFRLRATTDFANIDFPTDTVSPTRHGEDEAGWQGEWEFASLITSSPVGIQMPKRLNPGPLAARITFFAPVSLLFFFFVISILAVTSGRALHPMHYFLVGCAFFAFHLLFAYTVDHLTLAQSFLLSSIVSVSLVVTYVRHFVGWRFALRTVAPIQVVYLVLFSASFFWEGYTGLAITVGAISTLFAVMQRTGRLDWAEAFRASRTRTATHRST